MPQSDAHPDGADADELAGDRPDSKRRPRLPDRGDLSAYAVEVPITLIEGARYTDLVQSTVGVIFMRHLRAGGVP